MDFSFSETEERLQLEVRELLNAELPDRENPC